MAGNEEIQFVSSSIRIPLRSLERNIGPTGEGQGGAGFIGELQEDVHRIIHTGCSLCASPVAFDIRDGSRLVFQFVLNVEQELPCPPEWLCFNKCHRLLQVMKKVHKLWLFMCSWMLRNLLRNGDPDEGRKPRNASGYGNGIRVDFSLGPICLECAFDDKNTRRFHFKSWISQVAVLARLLKRICHIA